jgi:uncharacterized protein with von Willebrand factor type A (vWA) domain
MTGFAPDVGHWDGPAANTPGRAQHPNIGHNVIDFIRLLRRHEFPVSPAEAQDALRALGIVDIGDRAEFYLALRAILLWDPKREPQFRDLFEQFWGAWGDELTSLMRERPETAESPQNEIVMDQEGGLTYSAMEAMLEKDFSDFRPEELGAVARACVAIAKRIATRKSRRYKPTSRGSRVDQRRTLRGNLKYGGTILDLARLERKIRKPRIVLICDVSRSMEQYSVFLLQFIHSMQNLIGRVESFVFSTALHRVSPYFKHSDIMTAIDDIQREIPDWSGGTRIGESLETFNEQYGRYLVNRRTVVIILSDGLDTGQVELLSEQMELLHHRAARIIWLNPLLGKEQYEPLARGMAAALPHVDVFAAANNLASLQRLINELNAPGRGGQEYTKAAAAAR